MGESIGQKAVSGTIWASVDRITTMGLQFVVNMVLAWVLTPAEYGVVGVLTIFIAVSNTLIDGGFASALIQQKHPTENDYSTLFFWNAGFSLLCYLILFLIAPLVALFFKMPELCDVLRVLGLCVVASAFGQVQLIRLRKNLKFGTIAIVNLTGLIVASAISIYMAYNGFSYWSLVAMTVSQQATLTLLYWGVTRWHPSLSFSKKSFRTLFRFGGYLFAASILQDIGKNLQGVIIGKRFSNTQLGYYTQASKLDQVVSYSIPQALIQVLFPVFSSIQDDRDKLCGMMETGIRVISAVIMPLLMLLVIVASPLVLWLYHEAWLGCVPYFRILCVGGIFTCLQNVNFYAVAACGYSKVLFNWSFYKWGTMIVLLLAGMFFGMTGLMWSIVASNINIYLVNALLARKYVGFTMRRQIGAFLPQLFVGAVPAVVVGSLDIHWILQAILYVAIYVAILFICRMRVVGELRSILSRRR